MAPSQAAAASFTLPILVFGVVEVRRLIRELEALEDFMSQAALRQAGTQPALPRLSRVCEGLAQDNHLNLLQADHRKALAGFLQQLEAQAPRLHISFAADPSSAFTAKLVGWLRTNVDPYVLLEIGLQPIIAAGCVVRTNNKMFNLSLRERFANSDTLLLNAIQAASGGITAAPAVAAAAAPAQQAPVAPIPAAIQPAVPAVSAPALAQPEPSPVQPAAVAPRAVPLPATQQTEPAT
jgi:hypothetical protein